MFDLKTKTSHIPNNLMSYGGHYGPAFFNYFSEQNQLIANGTTSGVQLDFNTLGIINGLIDEATQVVHYPEFATKSLSPMNRCADLASLLLGGLSFRDCSSLMFDYRYV
jgi:hypothetical protein